MLKNRKITSKTSAMDNCLKNNIPKQSKSMKKKQNKILRRSLKPMMANKKLQITGMLPFKDKNILVLMTLVKMKI